MKARTAFVVALLAPSSASAKAPAKKDPPPPPSYEDVVSTYPDGVPLCPTDSEVVGGDDQRLLLDHGYIATNDEGEQRYQCFGTKLTVRKKVTLKGKTYGPGTKLTVDKDLYWVEVSGWNKSDAPTTKPGAVDPRKAPADVAAPPEAAAKTASGLASRVLRAGAGTVHPHRWDAVSVEYTGWTTDGKMFDTSAANGGPGTFKLDKVIAGWAEGLQLMVEGEMRRFWIPAKLAYGDKPAADAPAGMLVFDIELLRVIPGPKPIETPPDVAAPPANASKTASGIAYVTLAKGTGKRHPRARDRVRVHYSGWTTNGKLFDSSVARGEPAEFPLDGVIRGWTQGVQLMVVGDKMRFWIPGELAYGNAPSRPGVPHGMLVFEIELLEIMAED